MFLDAREGLLDAAASAPIMRSVRGLISQRRALKAFGIGVGLWFAGFFVVMLGGSVAIAWWPLMVAAGVAGLMTMVRSMKAGPWPVFLFPLCVLLTAFSGLGLIGALAM